MVEWKTWWGCFINTLPVRVRIADEGTVVSWLGGLLAGQVEQQEFAHSPLASIQILERDSAPGAAFNSLLVLRTIRQSLPQNRGLHKSESVEHNITSRRVTPSLSRRLREIR